MIDPEKFPLANDQLEELLDCEMISDYGTTTVRNYLKELLKTLWNEGSQFNAKRPYGSSSWQDNVYYALVLHSIVQGHIDTDGELVDVDTKLADGLIQKAIDYIWKIDEVIL